MSADPIADYYENKRREAAALSEQLRDAIARNAPRTEIEKLRRALEMARYVGD